MVLSMYDSLSFNRLTQIFNQAVDILGFFQFLQTLLILNHGGQRLEEIDMRFGAGDGQQEDEARLHSPPRPPIGWKGTGGLAAHHYARLRVHSGSAWGMATSTPAVCRPVGYLASRSVRAWMKPSRAQPESIASFPARANARSG